MPVTVTVCDETTAGDESHEFSLDLLTETLSVEELLRSRVYQEVKDYNTHRAGVFRGLVQPQEAEAVLGGFKVSNRRQIDWREQFTAACEAFRRGRILLLVDDRQVDDLTESVTVHPRTRVSFVKLVPLVGG